MSFIFQASDSRYEILVHHVREAHTCDSCPNALRKCESYRLVFRTVLSCGGVRKHQDYRMFLIHSCISYDYYMGPLVRYHYMRAV